MHIKQISISNFRSFRKQSEIKPFSPTTNAVVGRNGSGKSNLFDAVQFVLLAPRFANLRQEERQALLHEGSGAAAATAAVEIIFDNSDHRFALENSDEVSIRRNIGAKKDEFFLQSKRATKTEIQSLLEGAGFSKSNPYFIVQQGKVQDLCTMSDAERLTLLKEVAGTTVYDAKKAESLAKMEENVSSIAKIQEILADIEERLEELQSEKEELTQYQQLDRERRGVEYTLYVKEMDKATAIVDALEEERAEHVQQVSELHDAAKTTHDQIRTLEATLKAKLSARRRNRLTLQSLEQDSRAAVTKCSRLELECRELEESLQTGEEQMRSNQAELKRIEVEIVKAEKELADVVQPKYDEAVAELQALTDRRDQAKSQVDALYAKQGRGRQFASVAERDAFLTESIQELEAARVEKEAAVGEQRDALSNLRRSVEKTTKDIAAVTKEVQQKTNGLQQLTKTIDDKKRQRLELLDARKNDWRKAEELHEQVREARENMHRAISDSRKVMPKATAMGLEALKTIVEQERLVVGEQYFGMLMDNMTVRQDRYQTAVEVAAQNSLFHVIVDTDDTAARLLKRLEQGKLGRVTFLPLNQLRVENVQYPDNVDVRPMLDLCMEYDKKVERAMQHVFAKKLLARTPEIASKWSTEKSMDAITLDGDLCSRKGALTGGYVDVNKSRLRAHAKLKETQTTLRALERDYQETNRKAQEVDQSASNLMQELQRLEAKHAELTHMVTEKETELDRLQTRLENHKKQAEKTEKTTIPALERSLASIQADIGRLQSEMGTELTESLSDEDRQLLNSLKQEQTDLAPQIEALSDKLTQVGVARQKLQSLLQDNLLKRRDELNDGAAADGEGGKRRRSSVARLSSAAIQTQRKQDLEDRQRQLDEATRIKNDLDSRLEEARLVEEELKGQMDAAKNELEQLKSKDMKNAKALEEAQEKTDSLMNKRTMSISKRETYSNKIKEIGTLPSTALEKFSGKSISELMKALEGVNKKLKKYSHVNKKAYDQYVNFNEQREALLKRKEELDQGAEKVKELIENLDQQKDEAINRTFRGVSAHFKDVFKELVPNGAGEVIMRTALDETGATDEEQESSDDESGSPKKKNALDPNNPDVSLYRGVGIKVRFSEVGENYMMSQLSGGQKALVAMALIFAIQRCDPAPFYLFDELDQALDSTYRSAVARLVERQANSKDNPTQFIVSTFRPELVKVASQCYGISHQNKVSNMHVMKKRDALHFVANLQTEEEAVGEVSTVAHSKASRLTWESRKRKKPPAEEKDDASDDDDEQEQEEDAGEESTNAADSMET